MSPTSMTSQRVLGAISANSIRMTHSPSRRITARLGFGDRYAKSSKSALVFLGGYVAKRAPTNDLRGLGEVTLKRARGGLAAS
jgi:hypothetical protein